MGGKTENEFNRLLSEVAGLVALAGSAADHDHIDERHACVIAGIRAGLANHDIVEATRVLFVDYRVFRITARTLMKQLRRVCTPPQASLRRHRS